MERVREALKREEIYLLQVQKAAEHQLGVLKVSIKLFNYQEMSNSQ